LAALDFCQKRKQSFQRRTEAIPEATRQRGKTPFLAAQPAGSTQELVGFRSRALPPAASIRVLALERLCSTPQTKIRPLVPERFLAPPPAPKTRPDGAFALFSNTTGNGSTADGYHALFSNTSGIGNTANGFSALINNTIGSNNTAIGEAALHTNTTGNNNTALGPFAGPNSTGNVNAFVGYNAGINVTTASNVIAIGANVAGADVDNTCYIGNIFGVTTQNANAIPVLMDSNNQLGTMSSSKRFKKEIKPMDSASESILALKPVTFHYKSDQTSTPQFGLIAEEVAAVNPDLVVRDKNGEIYTVRYDAVNAMLLNEFLKEHKKVEELTKDFQATVAQLTARLDEQAAQIQKVSTQLEASKPAPQVVNNP
jgi:Chaperone of endosialidase